MKNNSLELNIINDYTFDIVPNEKGEMLIYFKVEDKECILPVSQLDLKNMVWCSEQALDEPSGFTLYESDIEEMVSAPASKIPDLKLVHDVDLTEEERIEKARRILASRKGGM
ncbi:hypothetical protein BEH_07635 [Priestia filamentosa]|uniref:Uncharacterized protein n=1 Tax=Priestia filamentosa TaxID=1402861 RepID=A0A0H4KGP5_9BACI|nr:hypothetical protein [Priestia filamentosa]AKO91981.1 hypothetical protein BEH_07635 [Priestia filamentosa]